MVKKYINVKFYENIIKSNKTIDLIEFFIKKKNNEIYFLMGADNLVNFHKWNQWKKYQISAILLFSIVTGIKKNH